MVDTGDRNTHDRDIREPLFEFLEEQYGKIRIIDEKLSFLSTNFANC